MQHRFRHNNRSYDIELLPTQEGFTVRIQGERFDIRVHQDGRGELSLERDGRSETLFAATDGETVWVSFRGRTYPLKKESGLQKRGAGDADVEGVLRAPMPGQVRELRVSAGVEVAQGDTLLVLEAMKMEIRIQAQGDGVVARVPVSAGEQVERDQVLIEITPQ